MVTIPGPAASATALPLMLAKSTLTSTSICASPPLMRPTTTWQAANRRSLIEPAFIRFAASMKSGMATSSEFAASVFMIWSAASPISRFAATR